MFSGFKAKIYDKFYRIHTRATGPMLYIKTPFTRRQIKKSNQSGYKIEKGVFLRQMEIKTEILFNYHLCPFKLTSRIEVVKSHSLEQALKVLKEIDKAFKNYQGAKGTAEEGLKREAYEALIWKYQFKKHCNGEEVWVTIATRLQPGESFPKGGLAADALARLNTDYGERWNKRPRKGQRVSNQDYPFKP